MTLAISSGTPPSAFDFRYSQGLGDTAGHQDAPAFFNEGPRIDREEAPGSSSSANAGPRRVPGFYMEPVVFQVKAHYRNLLHYEANTVEGRKQPF